jgi:3-phenylpropionate/trans-cinnamate dioxygenase ferredoxin reductase subunit
MSSERIVIVGAGQGGFQAAASLRDEGYGGAITIVGDEPDLPYQRPPLSKGYLTGKATDEQILLRPQAFYATRNIELRAPQQVTRILRREQEVELGCGTRLRYDHLVLATGARARVLAVPGAGLDGVVPLRDLAHAGEVRRRLQTAQHVVVVGAGFIGLEIAAIARAMGIETRILEVADRALKRALSAATGQFLADAHTAQGAQFHFSTALAEIIGRDGKVCAVTTADGQRFEADLVIVGVGVEPNCTLAQEAQLAVSNGIVVDRHLLTEDPAISAIGDCALYPSAFHPHPVRVESVQNAVDQARCVAARLAGKPVPYHKVPWFWSDQGANKLQIAGIATATDSAVVRGDMASNKFSVFRFRDRCLSAVESVNQPGEHLTARKLLDKAVPLTQEQAADTGFSLAALLA